MVLKVRSLQQVWHTRHTKKAHAESQIDMHG